MGYGIHFSNNWQEFLSIHGKSVNELKDMFKELDTDNSGYLSAQEVKKFAQRFYDCREPPDELVNRIIGCIDTDGDGQLSFDELMAGVEKMKAWTMDFHM